MLQFIHYLTAFVFILLGVDVLAGTVLCGWPSIHSSWKFPQFQIEGVMKYDVLMQLCWNRKVILWFAIQVFMIIVLVLAFLTRNIESIVYYKNT